MSHRIGRFVATVATLLTAFVGIRICHLQRRCDTRRGDSSGVCAGARDPRSAKCARHCVAGKSADPDAIAAPEGVIDPYLRLISFWNDETPIASLTYYATHPQSYYNDGSHELRPILASRIERGMREAWEATSKRPIAASDIQDGLGGAVCGHG
ncbi:MAG: hypothetical protein O3C40_00925 [Planctomycetota bacterium]|nr:hypothetical protein [Planctomycetota bacterium]